MLLVVLSCLELDDFLELDDLELIHLLSFQLKCSSNIDSIHYLGLTRFI